MNIVSLINIFIHVLKNILMRLKQFKCFVSVLFQNVRTSEIKREKIVLFQFYFTMCDGLNGYSHICFCSQHLK